MKRVRRNGSIEAVASAALLVLAAYRPSFAGQTMHTTSTAEVLSRDHRIGERIQGNEGHLSGAFKSLESQDTAIRDQAERDAARNGGMLTMREAGRLNREENALSAETRFDNQRSTFERNHPRRANILSRDAQLNYAINRDFGHLGGNYKGLERQDMAIRQQEQRDAQANGGFLTAAQAKRLGEEERTLADEIKKDHSR